MDRRLARMIDDHVTGRHDPNAPFNQPDPPPEYKCLDCGWKGDEPIEIEHREKSEHFGQIEWRTEVELRCPECAHEETIVPYDPDEDDELDVEEEDEEDEENEIEWDDEDEDKWLDETYGRVLEG